MGVEGADETGMEAARVKSGRGRRLAVGVAVVWATALAVGFMVSHEAKAGPPSVPFRQSHHADPTQLNHLFGDLPDGLRYTAGIGADEATPPLRQPPTATFARALYGTNQDPSAALVSLTEGDTLVAPGFDYLDTLEAQDRHAFTVRGRRVECGRIELLKTNRVGPSQVWCYAETDAELVFATGLHLDMTTMVALMRGLTIVAGEPRLQPSVLPTGMDLLRHESSVNSPQWATSGVTLSGPCEDGATLTVGWADEFELADLGWRFDDWTTVDVNGHPGRLGVRPHDGSRLLLWTAGDRAFSLEVHGTLDAVALARSLRPATPTEWAAMGKQPSPYHPTTATC